MDFIPPPMPAPGLNPEQVDAVSSDDDSIMQTDEEKIASAQTLKAEGLVSFQLPDYESALSKWSSALTSLKGASSKESDDIRISLWLNCALCCMKLSKWSECVSDCTEVLRKDRTNKKALFRRSSAYLDGLGNGEEAKDDLMKLIRAEPGNKQYRVMYETATVLAVKQKAQQKSAYSNLFSKPLYDDKEKARAEKLKAEEERVKRRKIEFEDEMSKRASEGRDLVDFEGWEKEMEEAKKSRAKTAEEQNEERRKKEREMMKKKTEPVVEEEEEYTEEEKRILADTKKKGYCYFKSSELTEEERAMKQKINLNAPARIVEEKAWTADQAGTGTGLSSWNSAGTSYEEKDMTRWAKDCLTNLLTDVKNAEVAGGVVDFVEVPTLEGEANAAVVRGTKRYFYDFNIVVKFKFSVPGCDDGSGELRIQPSNITSSGDPDSPDWLKEASVVWRQKKGITQDVSDQVVRKCSEISLCLFKGFEEQYGSLVNSN
eukprot:GHVH01001270.1.p1 GENE.GHVH01001270.1~~GHVH01001270.1.p1  ORF type:complete len:496 (+),score=109.94 GHVH01001270.1:28-1488(+)